MESRRMATVAAVTGAEFIEKKSRFIGQLAPAADESAALGFVTQIKAYHSTARHNCYAWITGDNNSSQRSSDDGEPAGTAGRPIMETLKQNNLSRVVLVVTRYFGGILLGAGGLTRAYAKAAQLAVDQATLVVKVPARRYALLFDYAQTGVAEAFAASCRVEGKQYGEQACIFLLIEQTELDFCRQRLADMSGGTLHLRDLGEEVLLDQPYCAE